MKPRVFLSHNKNDKIFIEKIANDLRSCGINVWYDEWEIPPGESIRKKIFEDGITSCDLFFVYLTENSIKSIWVQKELDSAFIQEIENQNSFLAMYVDSDSSRKQLSIDLRALNIPKFSMEDYSVPFGKLVSKSWISFYKNELARNNQNQKIKVLELENRILQLQNISEIDVKKVKNQLGEKKFKYNNINFSLLEIVILLKLEFANGIFKHKLYKELQKLFNVDEFDEVFDSSASFKRNYDLNDFTGELIILGLLQVKTSNDLDQLYQFTENGLKFLHSLIIKN